MKLPLYFAACALSASALAQTALYPTVPSVRYFGSNQGDVADCEAHALVNALESAFAKRGLPVKLSLWWAHAKNMLGDRSANPRYGVALSNEDANILSTNGGLIPHYMWPENLDESSRCCNSSPNTRPGPASQAAIDPLFPKAEALGFSISRVLISVDAIKDTLKRGEAIRMYVHDGVLAADAYTGLYPQPYEQLRQAIWSSPIDHMVAIVGYDDELGGFIVQNSHNNPVTREINLQARAHQSELLEKFRSKISQYNLSAYELIPYAYFVERTPKLSPAQAPGPNNYYATVMNPINNFEVIHLDYEAFANYYSLFASRYQTAAVPFICERDEISLHKILRKYTQAKDQAAKNKILDMIIGSSSFDIAKLPVHSGNFNIVKQFNIGKFSPYYCGSAKQMPDKTFNGFSWMHPEVYQLLIDLGANTRSPLLWEKYLNLLIQWEKESKQESGK